jgi:hypothetical protein
MAGVGAMAVLSAAAPPGIGGVRVGATAASPPGCRRGSGLVLPAASPPDIGRSGWKPAASPPRPWGSGGKSCGFAVVLVGPWPCGLGTRQKPGSLAVGRLRGSEEILFFILKRKETL